MVKRFQIVQIASSLSNWINLMISDLNKVTDCGCSFSPHQPKTRLERNIIAPHPLEFSSLTLIKRASYNRFQNISQSFKHSKPECLDDWLILKLAGSFPALLFNTQMLTHLLSNQSRIVDISTRIWMDIITPEPVIAVITILMPVDHVEIGILLGSSLDRPVHFCFPISGWHVTIDPEDLVTLTNRLHDAVNLGWCHWRIGPQVYQHIRC